MDTTPSHKRPPSPHLISNPFIKKKNLQWTLNAPGPIPRSSPPLDRESYPGLRTDYTAGPGSSAPEPRPTAPAVESGAAIIDDHLQHFSEHLAQFVRQRTGEDSILCKLSIDEYAAIYTANAGSEQGAHFVIHQHDHPIAGTHYDLRLQINETSSVSWAIMYGLPGDPNSMRLNRNATETRIHSIWNHLIETASPETGSLMIWDTGTYSILPRRSKYAPALDPDSGASDGETASPSPPTTQQSLLHAAFQARKIKIRLHGTKLPDPYVIYMRLTKTEDAAGRAKATPTKSPRRRRRRAAKSAPTQDPETSNSETNGYGDSDADLVPVTSSQLPQKDAAALSALEKELRELDDDEVRRTNAYKGATNSIGSIHQRKWYLSLERDLSGFAPTKSKSDRMTWEPKRSSAAETLDPGTSDSSSRLTYPFYVRGTEFERSVVTGRLGADILCDEGVRGFVPRMGWKPVVN
ncbi:ABC1 domain containing protein [Cordyceps militaris CM01]|uniref:ABC1 domain containing protein n=1 Tax=Cordyceps militaris (strain CM01) TaxID=983644 RepID=G3JJD8_CORMM|nr:ABC1 domain containing protein [Cordyceps militaris CM01]EGX91232.1 ABC1 domain containing protein [Cordyceps militaris CM01]